MTPPQAPAGEPGAPVAGPIAEAPLPDPSALERVRGREVRLSARVGHRHGERRRDARAAPVTKAGLASSRNLAELCRESVPRATNIGLWIQAEIVAIATDLAEFVGAAVGLNLLFDAQRQTGKQFIQGARSSLDALRTGRVRCAP